MEDRTASLTDTAYSNLHDAYMDTLDWMRIAMWRGNDLLLHISPAEYRAAADRYYEAIALYNAWNTREHRRCHFSGRTWCSSQEVIDIRQRYGDPAGIFAMCYGALQEHIEHAARVTA